MTKMHHKMWRYARQYWRKWIYDQIAIKLSQYIQKYVSTANTLTKGILPKIEQSIFSHFVSSNWFLPTKKVSKVQHICLQSTFRKSNNCEMTWWENFICQWQWNIVNWNQKALQSVQLGFFFVEDQPSE